MFRCVPPWAILLIAGPAAAAPLRPGAVVGLGVVGPNQYDNGKLRGVIAAGVSGPWHPNDSWSLGGIGLAFRASNGIHQDVSEVGLAIPIATLRKGRWITQTGVMIQRANLRKNLFWVGAGVSFPQPRALSKREQRSR